MPQQLTEAEATSCLNAILVGYEHLECLDCVAQTSLYRHKVKNLVHSLNVELRKQLDEPLADLCGIDDATLFNLMEHKKQLMKKIATLRPEFKSGLNEIIDQYIANPDATLGLLGITIIDRDKIEV